MGFWDCVQFSKGINNLITAWGSVRMCKLYWEEINSYCASRRRVVILLGAVDVRNNRSGWLNAMHIIQFGDLEGASMYGMSAKCTNCSGTSKCPCTMHWTLSLFTPRYKRKGFIFVRKTCKTIYDVHNASCILLLLERHDNQAQSHIETKYTNPNVFRFIAPIYIKGCKFSGL